LGEGETTKAWNSYNSRYSGGRSGSGGGAGYGGYRDYSGNGYGNGSGIALLEGMLKFTLMNLTSGKSAMCFFGIFLGKPWLLQIYINLRYVTNTDLPKFQRQVQGKTC
jgi:hypothetical protein